MPLGAPPPLASNDDIDTEVRRGLATLLLAQQRTAQLAHVVALGALAVLLWGDVPAPRLGGVIAAVVFAIAVRAVLTERALRSGAAPHVVRRQVGIAVAVVALAWGGGAGWLAPDLAMAQLGLLAAVLGVFVAGGAVTLVADPRAFAWYTTLMLAPLVVGIVAASHDRWHLTTAALVISFAGFMLVMSRTGHRALVGQLSTAARLERSERAATRERARLDALIASVPLAIAVLDPSERVRVVNPAFQQLFGYAPTEAVGQDLDDLIVPEGDRAGSADLCDRARAGDVVHAEVRRRRKDGTLVSIRLTGTSSGGGDEGDVLVLYEDITERQQAEQALRATEQRLRQVLSSSTAVIYVTKVVGERFVPAFVSENVTRVTGHEVDEAMQPTWWFDHVHLEDRPRVLAALPGLLTSGELTVEYRFRRKDQTYRWIRDETRLVRDAAGEPVEVVGAWVDITDRKHAEEVMREARDTAERATRAKAAFLANMSHEIRTPLNAVLGFTELVLDTELSAEQRQGLELVRASSEALLTILNDILDYSKIEAEHLDLESIPFDLPKSVHATATLLAVRAREKHLELTVDLPPDVPHMVRGDPTRLRQVLMNLIGNAIKFTAAGEVAVAATTVQRNGDRAAVRFSVRDTGIGISAGAQASIFEEFTQADVSTTRRFGGTGLGLAISRRLVALMGGELTVTSALGRGSDFSFALTFPIEAGASLAPASRAPVSLSARRVLVVDDHETNRRILRDMLGAEGMAVHEAPRAQAGLEALRRAARDGLRYDLAILDAQMPDQDGFALAAAVRADSDLAETRLLMLTSAGQRGDGDRCRQLGIQAYLAKPIARADLIEAVGVVLAGAASAGVAAEVVTRHSIAESRQALRILLAEDNPVNQQVATAMLVKRGHQVDVASNGREAVEAVSAHRYDVVLMDIQMPEMDGFAATAGIRALPQGRTLPIIALTAHALSGERERCIAGGMSDYLAKPFKARDLFAAVEGGAARVTAAAPVDLDAFRASMRGAGAEAAIDGILELFIRDAGSRLDALALATTAGNAADIAKAAHAFRSAAGSIGARGLAAVLEELEQAGRAGVVDSARRQFERARSEAEAVVSYLRQVRERTNDG
jgi:PAS domain S-box-containing protein